MAGVTPSATDRYLKAVLKLIELTQIKSLAWSPASSGDMPSKNGASAYRDVYTAIWNDRALRIFEAYVPNKESAIFNAIFSQSAKRAGTDSEIREWKLYLEVSEARSDGWWEFPSMEATKDLLRAVKYQISGAEDFIDDLLRL